MFVVISIGISDPLTTPANMQLYFGCSVTPSLSITLCVFGLF